MNMDGQKHTCIRLVNCRMERGDNVERVCETAKNVVAFAFGRVHIARSFALILRLTPAKR
jgi:hypothetical protein